MLASGAETWRYVLLLASREGALSADAVAASDALVIAAWTGTVLLGLVAGGFVVAWTPPAAVAAVDAQRIAAVAVRQELLLGGLFAPGWNLVVPGPVLAEIEHGALERLLLRRPRPSRMVVRLVAAVGGRGVLVADRAGLGRGAPVCRPGRTGPCCTRC